MILGTKELKRRLTLSGSKQAQEREQAISITPFDPSSFDDTARSSIDFILGQWFLTQRLTKKTQINLENSQTNLSDIKRSFVPVGKEFVIHPGRFVLGCTLEWLSLPIDIAGRVVGKSSHGRHGLIIETAAAVHPGFSGCLTLELTNVGEIPLVLRPGMPVCQIVFQEVKGNDGLKAKQSRFAGRRIPTF
jgi:dCTP deaminase